MAVNKDTCVTLLHNQFVKDFSQMNNISTLTADSRWKSKTECLSYYSFTEIKTDLQKWKQTEKEWENKIDEGKPVVMKNPLKK